MKKIAMTAIAAALLASTGAQATDLTVAEFRFLYQGSTEEYRTGAQAIAPVAEDLGVDVDTVAAIDDLGAAVTSTVGGVGSAAAYAAGVALNAAGATAINTKHRQDEAAAVDEFLDGTAAFAAAGAGALADFVTPTTATEFSARQRQLLRLAFDGLTIGIATGGAGPAANRGAITANVDTDSQAALTALVAANAPLDAATVTRENVTLLQIVQALFTVYITE